MESRCLRHTDLPHTSKLFADFVYEFDRVAPFYGFAPCDPSSYTSAAARLQYPDQRRAALLSVLREQNGNSPTLDLLARPGTTVVATGQQIGLLSGPAYTIYKALTAVRLARRLTDQGIPSVAVFWLATEDHDFAEINHCWLFDSAHRPIRIETRSLDHRERPVGEIAIADSPADEVRRWLHDFPFADDVAALAQDAYSPGRTFGSAFGELLKKLLSSYGLLYLDPMRPAAREMAAPLLRQAVRTAPELTRLVLDRNHALEAAGYHTQVHVESQSSLVFLLEGGRRVALRRRDGSYISRDRRFSTEELADRANQLSPNALLRPVVQDYLLPTVAYVAGPAELAYLAQAQVLYRELLGQMPVVLHRNSFTLLDRRSEKLIRRYGLTFCDFLHGEDGLRERVAAKLIPPVLDRGLHQATGATEQQLERLRDELMSFDPTLAAALDKSRRKILYQISKIGRKVARESLRRDERARQDAAYLGGLVYPEKHPQERVYSILPFLAKHGLDLIDHIYENIHLDCPDHQLLVV
jgi:bacillithiol biosynthesis cysteine-adding enzyme BshC